MGEEFVERGFDALDSILGPHASHRVELRRDATDSFAVSISTLDPLGDLLSKEDVLPLLPVGSTWQTAIGWRSFYGVPFRRQTKLHLALGAEGILRHATRGAYPIAKVFLFEICEATSLCIVRAGQ